VEDLARAFDDTDVAAVAVATAAVHGMSSDEMVALRRVLTAPVLRDDLCLDECQVYDSRLRGADAVRIPIRDLDDEQISKLCEIAISLHVTPVLEVASERDLHHAPVRPPHCVGLDCVANDGFVDVSRTTDLAQLVPSRVVVVVLAEPRSLEEARQMRGFADGVVVGDVLLDSQHPAEEVTRFLESC
jgi:indole-3-glycerol phosphate synthase